MKKCWVSFNPNPSGNYLATPGNRYAVLLSVSSHATLDRVTSELAKEGFISTYSWQSGQPSRKQFIIDRWIETLPPPAQDTSWLYFELTYSGDMPKTLARHVEKCVLFVCATIDIAYAFEERLVPDDYAPCGPSDPARPAGACPAPLPCPGGSKSSVLVPALVGAGVGGATVFWLMKVLQHV